MALTPACFKVERCWQQAVNDLGAHCRLGELFRRERAMADKPEFVDMISEATHQRRRRYAPRVVELEVKETSRLSHWPPDRWVQWRLETLTPWKLKPWKFKNWD